jgi:hypothetical protein
MASQVPESPLGAQEDAPEILADRVPAALLGMENDPLEDLDREEAKAIAQAVQVRREGGDVSGIMRLLDALASNRLQLIAEQRRRVA